MLPRPTALVSFRLRALLAGLFWLSLLSTVPAQEGTAKAFLEGIYRHYIGADAPGVDYFTPEKAALYFEPALAKRILEQDQDSEYEGGGLGFDSFSNSQDMDIKAVDITMASETAERAKGVASFRNSGTRQTITYDLVKTQKGWRIANISWRGTKDTLLSLLAKRR